MSWSASGISAHAASTPTPGASPAAGSGTANVAFAGSLELLNEQTIGPGFTSSTGYPYQGQGAGAVGLSQEIAAGEITPNVFESIGSAPVTALEPKFTSWYVQLASSPIVVVYSPTSKYGSQLAAIAHGKKPIKDLFTLMAKPDFTLGRTDPNTDPQGQAFWEMVQAAQSLYHLPKGTASKILGPLSNPKETYAETALESDLQSGQLDASSAYRSQAIQMHLNYINLPSRLNFGEPSLAKQYAKYTIKLDNGTTVHGAPTTVDITQIGSTDPTAAQAWITYQLSKPVRNEFKKAGYQLVTPKAFGKNVPAKVKNALSS